MAEEKLLKSLADGVLKINESSIDVAVLENGVRIITHSGVFRALGREPRGNARLDQIPAFMDAKISNRWFLWNLKLRSAEFHI